MKEHLLEDVARISQQSKINEETIRTGIIFMETTDMSSFDEKGEEDIFQVHHIPLFVEGKPVGLHVAYHFSEIVDIGKTSIEAPPNGIKSLCTNFLTSKLILVLIPNFQNKRWKIEIRAQEGADFPALGNPAPKLGKFWNCVNNRCGGGIVGTACAVAAGACIADPTKISCGAAAAICGSCIVACMFLALK